MQYNQIPGTDLRVSALCLGTMTFGAPVEEKDAVRLVQYAADKGINFIDTANMYEGYNRAAGSAGGVAEEIVGKAVRSARSRYIVATKLGMKVGNAPEDDYTSPAAIALQLRRSLKRLQTDYVDIYYLHRYDPDTNPHDIVRALEKEKQAGNIRAWGVSNYTAAQLESLLAAVKEENASMPALCQPALSLLKDAAVQDILPLCVKNGVGVVPYQVLQGGILSGKYHRGQAAATGTRAAEKPEWMMPMTEEVFDKLERYEQIAVAENLTMAQYAMRWAMHREGVISTLVGVKRTAQLDEALAAAL